MGGEDYTIYMVISSLVLSEYHYHYVGVSHVFEAVRVPALESQAGAYEAAQEDKGHQTVHGNNLIARFFVSVGPLPVGNC